LTQGSLNFIKVCSGRVRVRVGVEEVYCVLRFLKKYVQEMLVKNIKKNYFLENCFILSNLKKYFEKKLSILSSMTIRS
jgi:hypothetical protein